MKKKSKYGIFFFLTLFCMSPGLFLPTFAQEAPVLFEDGKVMVFASRKIYADNDLFGNFKDLMPGDAKEEELILQNQSEEFDYIKVYIRALLHDKDKNPLSDSVVASGETIRSMEDFLSKLSIKVYHKGEVIYDASAKELGGLEENIYLGTLKKGESIKLKVELVVPLELGNEYMERMGEIDWFFLVEAFDEDDNLETISNREALVQTGQKNQSIYLFTGMVFLSFFLGIMVFSKKQESR